MSHETYAAQLPAGIRARFVDNTNGLVMHFLEAGFDRPGRPLVVLLHGFPELAYSWRKIMVPLAAAGYHVVAPDQRGYGRTTGWDAAYDGDLASFRFLNLVRDTLGMLAGLELTRVRAVVGHDFGAAVAAYCALIRPDIFESLVLMSAPFAGPPSLVSRAREPAGPDRIHEELAALARPRKHYHQYYSTREANDDMRRCPQGVHAFMRAYFHHKSADWKRNQPFALKAWSAAELAQLPTYYVMERDRNMAETVAEEMPSPGEIAACGWLPEDELRVYSEEFARTGFQGGLQWYRCRASGAFNAELQIFGGRTIDVPACFISGRSDWGVYQTPGAVEKMRSSACSDFRALHLLDGAGHWVQQEQPEKVIPLLLDFWG